MFGRRLALCTAALIAAIAFAAPFALASGGTTKQGYPSATQPPSAPTQASTPTHSGVAGASKTLPFTGLQLGVFVVIAGVLLVSGLLLRSAGRDRSS